ncbi:MAG: cytochrome c family protein [Alphaproteobacteria bacterium]|jgi:cytochrome c|nr:cytochrome c family protein [Alphaproteobacteria bacterium]|tara:strand:- start:390 stop:779 length:390 start_codon:yes stop_codon:yes gene_type:complete
MLKLCIKFFTIIFLLTYISSAHAGDAEKGKKVFNKCKACHGIDEGGKNKLGPNLWNMVGAPIAAVDGYKYSKALLAYAGEAGNWNEENLDAWLKKPKDLVRKTKMIFPGLKKEADRADLIAYLKENGNN